MEKVLRSTRKKRLSERNRKRWWKRALLFVRDFRFFSRK